MDLSFIRRNLRSFLRIPENVTPTASASLPVASLGGSPPEVQLVVRPAQVIAAPAQAQASAAPRFRKAPVGASGLTAYQEKLRFEARLKTEFGLHEKIEAAGMDTKARRKVLADFDRYVAGHPIAKAAPDSLTVDDEGRVPLETPAPDPENPAGIDEIISQLLDLVLQLKKTVQVTDADDAEARAALADFPRMKLTTSRRLMAVTKKMCERPKLTPAQKISRGFSAQTGVQAIQNCLRGKPAARAASALAPVGGGPAPAAPVAAASPAGSRECVQALRAEIAQLDREQRKQFSNERNARHAALTRELKAELRNFHVQ